MGRPKGSTSKLTAEVQEAICKALEIGVTEQCAAEANDVPESTFHRWMQKGAEGIDPYCAFRIAVTRARARAQLKLAMLAQGGGPGSSQATWFLERRWRRDYGPTQKIELGGDPDGVSLAIERLDKRLDELPLDKLAELAAKK